MRTIVVTGTASGMGAASKRRLEADGHRVIGIDQRDADIVADLSTPDGRAAAIGAALEQGGNALEGVVTWAGIGPVPGARSEDIVSVNFFGTVEILEALRPNLARGDAPAAVAISSNITTTHPAVPVELTSVCLDRDEARAREMAKEVGPIGGYAASKLAVAWWVRRNAPAWAAEGINLNAIVPGVVETPMVEALERDEVTGPNLGRIPIPVGRRGRPEDLAAAAAFLLGPDARFVSGVVLFVDGGTDALLSPDAQPAPLKG